MTAAVVTREAATYTPESRASFFADLAAVHRGNDFDAAQRLLRHERETGAVDAYQSHDHGRVRG